jgi:hypothetical protein
LNLKLPAGGHGVAAPSSDARSQVQPRGGLARKWSAEHGSPPGGLSSPGSNGPPLAPGARWWPGGSWAGTTGAAGRTLGEKSGHGPTRCDTCTEVVSRTAEVLPAASGEVRTRPPAVDPTSPRPGSPLAPGRIPGGQVRGHRVPHLVTRPEISQVPHCHVQPSGAVLQTLSLPAGGQQVAAATRAEVLQVRPREGLARKWSAVPRKSLWRPRQCPDAARPGWTPSPRGLGVPRGPGGSRAGTSRSHQGATC